MEKEDLENKIDLLEMERYLLQAKNEDLQEELNFLKQQNGTLKFKNYDELEEFNKKYIEDFHKMLSNPTELKERNKKIVLRNKARAKNPDSIKTPSHNELSKMNDKIAEERWNDTSSIILKAVKPTVDPYQVIADIKLSFLDAEELGKVFAMLSGKEDIKTEEDFVNLINENTKRDKEELEKLLKIHKDVEEK